MMDDLISRSELFKSWNGLSDAIKDPDLLIDEMIKRTQDAPAVYAESVRPAKWEVMQDDVIRCSRCGAEWAIRERGEYVIIGAKEDLRWCPSCGAKMDAEVEGD